MRASASFTDSASVSHVKKPRWYRSTFYNALILGICNFLAPGIWGAMNSLGAGGEASPSLVNAANALTFCLMVLSCFFSSALVKWIGIKAVLIIGTMGYAPYAAGLYTNNRFGTQWLVLVGAALCGLSAGLFWMAEAAIALATPSRTTRASSWASGSPSVPARRAKSRTPSTSSSSVPASAWPRSPGYC
ncbi:hypothetical protein NUW54_g4416 [Trametes sanguinea]|uniref:Uncharacterized protein n=1 Tax=Trametes sanguinea TaxID=158606 RepID=A0ACC1PYJ9_9APHY|nr:hypothetical protein NUW54_g4416 [Trametes sanguinea]